MCGLNLCLNQGHVVAGYVMYDRAFNTSIYFSLDER
jgi:hypothetical protein